MSATHTHAKAHPVTDGDDTGEIKAGVPAFDSPPADFLDADGLDEPGDDAGENDGDPGDEVAAASEADAIGAIGAAKNGPVKAEAAKAMAAIVEGDTSDPLVKALGGQHLTKAEGIEAGKEAAALSQTAGEPPPEVAEKLKEAGVVMPAANGKPHTHPHPKPPAKPTGSHAQQKPLSKKEKRKARSR